MVISSEGINNIRQYEGLRLTPYIDDDKTTLDRVEYSIGYGHQIQPGESYLMSGITTEQAEQIFVNDLMKFSAGVNNYLKIAVPQSVFDSLVSFAYNIGLGNFSGSALLQQINAGSDWESILDTWKTNWDATDSLATRREKEALYAEQGLPPDSFEPGTDYAGYKPPNEVKKAATIILPSIALAVLLYLGGSKLKS